MPESVFCTKLRQDFESGIMQSTPRGFLVGEGEHISPACS